MRKKALVSLSGGMDSATLLGVMVDEVQDVTAVSFHYGAKHGVYELEAARQLANHYHVNHFEVDMRQAFGWTDSNLMKSGGVIPEGHYAADNMKQTVVPGRNLIFASILASIAESRKIDSIALAVHSGDHAIYPDCRPEFVSALAKVVEASTEGRVAVLAPFMDMDKTDILHEGFKRMVPYFMTRTCYKDQRLSCGKCGSCNERLEAWNNVDRPDPIRYEGKDDSIY